MAERVVVEEVLDEEECFDSRGAEEHIVVLVLESDVLFGFAKLSVALGEV